MIIMVDKEISDKIFQFTGQFCYEYSWLKAQQFTVSGILLKWVLPPKKETSSPIFIMAIFKKIFADLMCHITREYAGKKIEWFLNVFTVNNHEYFNLMKINNSYFSHKSGPVINKLKPKIYFQAKYDFLDNFLLDHCATERLFRSFHEIGWTVQ